MTTTLPAQEPGQEPAQEPGQEPGQEPAQEQTALDSLGEAATRLATLLISGGGGLADRGSAGLVFEDEISPRPLEAGAPCVETWAVDGGQALAADARSVQVLVTRASRVCFRERRCAVEEEGPLRAHVVGGGESRRALAALGLDLDPDTAVDAQLLRERWEWDALERAVGVAAPGALVLLDGDLVADWRLPARYVGAIFDAARTRGVVLAGVTKHSSLSRGGAPLAGQLEMEAEALLGPLARWWAPVARHETGMEVVVARLDPAARFAFRVDLAAGTDPETALGALAAVSDDAAFPGYPYPLAVADRLAACPPWVRHEAALALDELLAEAGVPAEVRDRAFADRHRLMERA